MTDDDVIDKFKFKNMSKRVQIIFVGLLAGFLILGIYMISIGILQSIETPKVVSSGAVGSNFTYNYNLYSNKKEIEIYNDYPLNVNNIWVGSKSEYLAFKTGSFVTSDKHLFNGPFLNPKSLDYKFTFNPLTTPWTETVIIAYNKNIETYSFIYDGENVHVDIIM